MINANELMIGNWVTLENRLNPIQVTPRSFKYVVYGQIDFEPIPLTPEILEKAGFEWSDIGELYTLDAGNIQFISGDGREVETVTNQSFQTRFGNTIRSVHSLQQVYFALTGQPLNITL